MRDGAEYLPAQADAFARSEREEKASACFARNDRSGLVLEARRNRRQVFEGRASWGAAGCAPTFGATEEAELRKKEEARSWSGPLRLNSKMGISGGRRRGCRRHRGNHRHLHHRAGHLHRRHRYAGRCRRSCDSEPVQNFGQAENKSAKALSRNATTGSSSAARSTSVKELRMNGRHGSRCLGSGKPRRDWLRLTRCLDWRRWTDSIQPRADGPCACAQRRLPHHCCSGCRFRNLAARYRDRWSCPALPTSGC